MPEGHDTTIEVSNIMYFVLYTQILKQFVLNPASPGITLIEIVISWVYYTIPFGFSLFWHFRMGTWTSLSGISYKNLDDVLAEYATVIWLLMKSLNMHIYICHKFTTLAGRKFRTLSTVWCKLGMSILTFPHGAHGSQNWITCEPLGTSWSQILSTMFLY